MCSYFICSQKITKFDIESDFQKSSFSSNLDKNNWTRKVDLNHTLGFVKKHRLVVVEKIKHPKKALDGDLDV